MQHFNQVSKSPNQILFIVVYRNPAIKAINLSGVLGVICATCRQSGHRNPEHYLCKYLGRATSMIIRGVAGRCASKTNFRHLFAALITSDKLFLLSGMPI
jgi:hypothetical protein